MKKFSDVLATLENSDHLQGIQLFDSAGALVATIENKPGSQGSVKVYNHLLKKYGSISLEAAQEGLDIYCEHTQDAEQNAGKHPNIDRLFAIIKNASPISGKAY